MIDDEVLFQVFLLKEKNKKLKQQKKLVFQKQIFKN